MTGSLAPPPPYGSEQGSILLEMGGAGQASEAAANSSQHYVWRHHTHGRTRSGNFLRPGAVRSPTDISLAHLPSHEEHGETSSGGGQAHLGQPPDYSSPPGSIRTRSPPIPSYSQAVSGERPGQGERDRLLPQSDGAGERHRSGTV